MFLLRILKCQKEEQRVGLGPKEMHMIPTFRQKCELASDSGEFVVAKPDLGN